MALGDDVRFHTTAPITVPASVMTALPLDGRDGGDDGPVSFRAPGIVFQTLGWYEVLLRVDWDPGETTGTRFAHTKIPGQEPLHSEAISAAVLNQLSDGRQLLRGNSLFGPDRTSCLILEVWHDSGRPLEVCYAELVIRELQVPWPGAS